MSFPASTSVADGFADFDELNEGFLDYTVQSGGITFWDSRTFFNEPPAIFVAEDGSGYIPTVPDIVDHFSPPNVFQTSGYITGGGYLITRWAEVSMTTGQIESYAFMDVFYKDDDEFQGTEMVLEAHLHGEVVAEVSQVINNPRRDFRATSFEIRDVEFDRLRLFGRGNPIPPLSGFLGSLDNVEISGGGAGSGLELRLPDQAVPGSPGSLTAFWGTPGEQIYFAYAHQLGRSAVPRCSGLVAHLRRPVVMGSAITDANGEATISFDVPAAARGRNVYFQALHPESCTASNYVPFTFEPE